MAISLSHFPILSVLLLALYSLAEAGTVTYDFNIGWVRANPDGLFERTVIGINGAWPPPTMEATKGDRVIVNVENSLGNQTTTLHFHGLFQNGTTYMDGPGQVTQCDILSGQKMIYNFTVEQSGTYWYHSHDKGQYPDGIRAPFIIHDPEFPYKDQVDQEFTISVSDWYHDEMVSLISKFIYKGNPTGAEPVPNSGLINDTASFTLDVQPGKTYLVHMVNIGAFAGQYIWFEGHNMSIVEVDGVFTEEAEAEMIYISAAQRCSFLLTTKNETTANYAFVASMDTSLFDVLPDDLQWNSTGHLVYNKELALPTAAEVAELNEFDDFTLVPYDKQPLFRDADQTVQLDVIMDNLGDGKPYAFFNNISYVSPKVPTLFTAMTTGENASNPEVYGEYSHPFVLDRGQVVDIILNNLDSGKHPFHLHGHHFQTLVRTEEEAGVFDGTNSSQTNYPAIPMRRDTLVLNPNGNLVIRFRADNPGIWLFHCHIEWHMDQGLIATIVEAPLDLQKSLVIPDDHKAVCAAAGIPIAGNAAGNTVDVFNLKGQNHPPAPLPAGFTPRGIVAMAFSVLAAVLGMAAIVWYGLADMGAATKVKEEQRIAAFSAEQNSRERQGSSDVSETKVG